MRSSILAAGALVAALAVSACGGSASTPSAAAPTTAPTAGPSTAAESAAPTTAPTSSATPAPSTAAGGGTTYTNATHGTSITLPAEWVAVTPDMAADAAKLAAVRATNPQAVDSLVAALTAHPEYWIAALRTTDSAVLTGQVVNAAAFDTWATDQKTALEASYGKVDRTDLTAPAKGVKFDFTASQLATRLVGFERPGGVALFTLAGRPTATDGWDEALASFTDAGS